MFPTTQVSGPASNPRVQHGTDENLVVRFYFNKVFDKNYVKINIPGDQKTEHDRPVTDKDKQRFSRQWEQYKAQQAQSNGQVHISELGLNEHQIEHFRQFHITTVEQLANLSDSFVTQVGMGTRELQKRASAYLNDLQGRKTIMALEEANKHLENQNAVLQEQLISLTKRMESIENAGQVATLNANPAQAPKRRGRPPKARE